MVSRITLGNLVSDNGRTRLIGTESGLDTAGIVDSLVEARRIPAVQLESNNEDITARAGALNELRSLLNRFSSSVDILRNPPGVGNANENIFEFNSANLVSNNGQITSNFLNVTVEPGAVTQNFNITSIERLATATRQETGTFSLPDSTTASAVAPTASPTAGQFTAGSFTIRDVTGGPAVAITLGEGDSLQSVANAFNEVSDRTGVAANIIRVADGVPNDDFRIIFTATETGETFGFDLNDPGTIISDPGGVLANVTVTTSQPAQNARFFVDGIQIERETNSIDDVFEGLTFNLQQTTAPGDNINVAIQPDTELVTNAIFNFVDIYNEFRIFASGQTELGDDGLPTESALLAGDPALRSIVSRVNAEVASVVDGLSAGDPARLADIGLSFEDFIGDEERPFTRNILTVDPDALASALATDFEGVRGVFEFQFAANDANLTVFERTNNLGVSQFSLNINQSTGVFEASFTDSNGDPQTVLLDGAPLNGADGVVLTGRSGTVLDGLELIYASAGNVTVDVSITQGIGDGLFNALDETLQDDTGLLSLATAALQEQTERNLEEITSIDEQLETFRAQLERQFTSLEAALSRANNLLTLLDAQSNARNQ